MLNNLLDKMIDELNGLDIDSKIEQLNHIRKSLH